MKKRKSQIKNKYDRKRCLSCNKEIQIPLKCTPSRWKNRKYCSIVCMMSCSKVRKKISQKLKGKIFSEIIKNKISEAKIGKSFFNDGQFKKGHKSFWNEQTKLRMSIKMSKENNPSWEGGKSSHEKLERKKFKKNYSKKVLERDNFTCQMCGKRGGSLHVDHIKSWRDHVDLRFDIDNCRTLCRSCHYFVTFKKTMLKDNKWGNAYGT